MDFLPRDISISDEGVLSFESGGVRYKIDIEKEKIELSVGGEEKASVTFSRNGVEGTVIPLGPAGFVSFKTDGAGVVHFEGPGGLEANVNMNVVTGKVGSIKISESITIPLIDTKFSTELTLDEITVKNTDPADSARKSYTIEGDLKFSVDDEALDFSVPVSIDFSARTVLGIIGQAGLKGFDVAANYEAWYKAEIEKATNGITTDDLTLKFDANLSDGANLTPTERAIVEFVMRISGQSGFKSSTTEYYSGPVQNGFEAISKSSDSALKNPTANAQSSVNQDGSTLKNSSNYKISGVGNINADTGVSAFENYTLSDGLRVGNHNFLSGPTVDALNLSAPSTYGVGLSANLDLAGNRFNTISNSLSVLTPADPLVLDLNGDGVKLTSFSDSPVLFDIDNDGGSREQTGWVSAEDGILVHDLGPNGAGDGVINNISETLSEYYNGTPGSVPGVPGTKSYANGFAALKDLDKGQGVNTSGYNDNVFDSRDAAWNSLRVWVDANHDGKSWIDTNGNGVKDAGEVTELKTFADLGITAISLSHQTQNGEVRDGNEILSRGKFTRNNQEFEAIAASFLANPAGSTIAQTSEGIIATLENAGTKSFVSSNVNAALAENLNGSTLGVRNISGGAGNDTLTGDAQDNWLAGGLGADVFKGGAGNDVILADAEDLSNPLAIDGGAGADIVQVIGSKGIVLDMSKSNVEVVVGNVGDDLIVGGGGSSVFVRGGDGDDMILGGSANDALSGENGSDQIDGGAGNDVIRGHRGRDFLGGGSGDDLIEGGLEDDTLNGGVGNDVVRGDGGDDWIDGGAGIDIAEYTGNYSDYVLTKLDVNTWRVVDTKTGRDGADILKGVEKLAFSDVSYIGLNQPIALPNKDILTKDGAGVGLARTGSYYISKNQLLANDRSWQNSTLSIIGVVDPVGCTATLVSNQTDVHYGDILVTPNAAYRGVMSFKYEIEDAQHISTTVVINGEGTNEKVRGAVYLQTADLPTDPLLLEQWYLSDANVIPVWKDYTGKGVRIAQFETGGPFAVGPAVFDYQHPDLQANADKNWLNNQNNPAPQLFSNHSTMVAGVMVAARNGEGAVGVAYDAKLTGQYIESGLEINALTQGVSNALAKFKDYDVVNNSWNPTVDFMFGVTPRENLPVGLFDAINSGRNGLGTAIVMAAGNNRQAGSNTNTNTLISNRAVITVGAINTPRDIGSPQIGQKPFSTPGASILVSAAGSNIDSTSRELISENGSVFGADTLSAEGTSFAAPIVSGVIALMLEANPALGYRDIQTILAMTAVKFDDLNGTDWTTNGAKNWNGGGMHASHDYGFGKVDARAAVRLAETWFDSSTVSNLNVRSVSSGTLNAAIPDNGTVYSHSLTAATGVEIESAQVTVDIDHGRWGDLTIKLISPSGTESILLNRTGKALGSGPTDFGSTSSGVLNASFNTTHVRGEQSAGVWKLQVIDNATGAVGMVKSWKLELYGSATTDIQDTYVYTDEFGAFTGTQRSTLADTNGGIDGLNASAVRTGSALNLNNGSTSTIAGRSLTVSGDIEYAYGGDGNDTISGNALSNLLQGGRGNDTISGDGGLDVLFGGQGANSLSGGAGADIFAVQRNAGAVDTITDFDATGIEKIAIIGISSIDDYTKLTVSQEGADSRVALIDGQSILIKGLSPSQLSEQNFSFFIDNNAFNSYLTYRNNAAVGTVSQNADTLVLTNSGGALQSYGLGGNDALLVRSQRDLVDGGNGNDTIFGEYVNAAGGYPTITAGSDWIEGGAGNDILSGGGESDRLIGGSGNDELYGEDGNDVLIGSSGQDYLNGGAGDDVLTLDGDIGLASASSTGYLGTRVGGAGADTFKVLSGGTEGIGFGAAISASNMIGDFNVNQAGEVVDLSALTWIRGFSDLTIIPSTVNGITMAQIKANNGTSSLFVMMNGVVGSSLNASHFKFASNPGFVGGTASADSLVGDAGANTLDGRGGVDTMVGRTGDDTYLVDSTGDAIDELPGGGFDTAVSSVSYTLSANVEGLTLTDSTNINATGNAGRNRIRGNAGNNRLDGGAEADDLVGGAGNDTYVVDDQLDTVAEGVDQGIDTVESSVSWGLSANVENVILTGVGNINATGNELSNKLVGNASDNILDGVSGADTLEGGLGNDTYYLDNASDVVTENAGEGLDLVYVPFTYNLADKPNLENVALYGDAVANLTGNVQNNILVGNSAANTLSGDAGDDLLDGGLGSDVLNGGLGNDIYYVDNDADLVNENDAEGTETVWVNGVSSYTLRPFVENGTRLTAGTLIGNDLGNSLTGSTGSDALRGENGADTINGGAGNDTLVGGSGNDRYIFSRGMGSDVITEAAGTGGGVDAIEFVDGIKPTDLIGVRDGTSLTIKLASGEQIKFDWASGQGNAIEQFIFSGGSTVWGATEINKLVNKAPTGTVTISGTAATNETLTASNSLADADVMGAVTYQWWRGATATGATGATYLLTQADAGQQMSVKAVYTDGFGTSESVTSAPTATVISSNRAPTITSAGVATVLENSSAVMSVTATDPDAGNTLTYAINGGVDAAKFTINPTSGALAFVAAPNFEAPTDLGANNVYDVMVQVSDGTLTNVKAVAVTVGNVNEAPTVTSAATVAVTENSTTVMTVTGSDADAGSTLAYSINGGADAAKFTINPTSGALAFTAAPNFEAPTDVGANNVYDVVVQVSDGTLTNVKAVAVTVNNVNEAPTVTSAATAAVTENSTTVMTVTGSDVDAGSALSYAINGGADAAKFTINPTSGALAFTAAPNFEAPTDAGANNVYDVMVQVSDGALTNVKAVAVTVGNVYEAPTVSSAATAVVSENNTAVMTVTSSVEPGKTAAYSINGGADAAKFTINPTSGALAFAAAPNFEAPTDAGANNVYDVMVQVSDGTLTNVKAVAVTVGNVNEAPTVTSAATAAVAENSTAVMTVTGSDIDAGSTLSYAINGGADAAKFTINPTSGALAFAAAPNFEVPADAGADNVYDVMVQVSDGALTNVKTVAVTVGNVNEAPTVTSAATAAVAENSTAVMTVTGSDADAGSSLAYSINGGADAAKFTINPTSGALAFVAAPNFEAPTDVGANNVYDLMVQVSDGALTNVKAVAVTVGNINEAPTGSVTVSGVAIQGQTLTASNGIADPDGMGAITYQWLRDGTATGSTGSTYVLGQGDISKLISARAVYTDGQGASESVTSAPTAAVASGDVQSAVSYTMTPTDYSLTLTGTAAINAMGNSLRNPITGNSAANLIDGGGEADTMAGAGGNDVYVVDNIGDIVVEVARGGIDRVDAWVTYTLSAEVENLTLAGSSVINGTGNVLANTIIGNNATNVLTGNAGDDLLDGKLGADTMIGGAGDDGYYVDNASDVVTENANEGDFDYVETNLNNYVLGANVEGLYLTAGAAGALSGTGNALDNSLIGNEFSNTLTGGAGNDVLDGYVGADTLVGGTGNDTYYQDSLGDVIVENVDEGTDTVVLYNFTGNSYTLGATLENLTSGVVTLTSGTVLTLTGNAVANTIYGSYSAPSNALFGGDGNDSLLGKAGSDTLDGGTGADSLTGYGGNDTYIIDHSGDVVVEAMSDGIDQVNASVSHALSANVENLTLTGTAAINGTGNWQNNLVIGNIAANLIDGSGGADTLAGGNGNDIYVVDNTGDVVTEAANEGTDTLRTSVTRAGKLEANVENLVLEGAASSGTGNSLANTLTGNAANNTLDGDMSADTLIGGLGDDTYLVDNAGDMVVENLGEGVDKVISQVNFTLATLANVENITLLGTVANNAIGNALGNILTANDVGAGLYGDAGNDTLIGGTGNDQLNGGSGVDSLVGGLGNDVYSVENASDVVVEAANGGTQDRIESWVTYTASSEVENLTLLGSGLINATGNELANVLTGNTGNNTLQGLAGDDTLDGGAGADRLEGGAGNDTYTLTELGDVVIERLGEGTDTVRLLYYRETPLEADVENLVLVGTAAQMGTGNELKNVIDASASTATLTLYGNGGDDRLIGGQNWDALDGGVGADQMLGGQGNDFYYVDNIGDQVTEAYGQGTDQIVSYVNVTLSDNVENLTLRGTAAITGTGNILDNYMSGNALTNTLSGMEGNDVLTSSGVNDTLIGGKGDDLYYAQSATTITVELANEGTDTLHSQLTWTLSDNIENLNLIGLAQIDGSGNVLNNVLKGNDTGNTLRGLGGNDTLQGLRGNDTLDGGAGNDVYLFSRGDGEDLIQEASADATAGKLNVLRLSNDIKPEDIELRLAGADLILSVKSASDRVTIKSFNVANNPNGPDNPLQGIDFSIGSWLPGTFWDLAKIRSMILAAPNTAPVVNAPLADQRFNQGDSLGTIFFEVPNTAFIDSDSGDALSYTATLSNGNALPGWLLFNPSTRTFAGTTQGAAGGTISVGVTAKDKAGATVRDDFDIVVSAPAQTLVGTTGADSLVGSAGNDSLVGGEGNDTLTGQQGTDWLEGGGGADRLVGGSGDDVYTIDGNDVVVENASEGVDTVRSSVNFVLGESSNLENLFLLASAGTGTGNSLPNLITANYSVTNLSGNGGNDTLIGGTGEDRLDGGAGLDKMYGGVSSDTYVIDDAGDQVIEYVGEGYNDLVQSSISYVLGANIERLELTGNAALNGTGNSASNWLTGNSARNELVGGAGDDRLDGQGGADVMSGGLDWDTYIVDDIQDQVIETPDGSDNDIVESSVSYSLAPNVEHLRLIGNTALKATGNVLGNNLTGNSLNNELWGFEGDDQLDGRAGADTMYGGTGNDYYLVDEPGDKFIENFNEGTSDTVLLFGAFSTYAIPANVESLYMYVGTGTYLSGNSLDNTFHAFSGNDTIEGGQGNDRFYDQYASDDVYIWGAGMGQDSLTWEFGGTDLLKINAGVGADQMWFEKIGQTLKISVIGTNDSFSIEGWYGGGQTMVDKIQLGDGKVLTWDKMQNLVSAMASFTPPPLGQTTLPGNYQTSLNPVIASNWA